MSVALSALRRSGKVLGGHLPFQPATVLLPRVSTPRRLQHTTGGLVFAPEELLQRVCTQAASECEGRISQPTLRADGPDDVAASHVCGVPPHALQDTPIKRLPVLKPAKSMSTTVTTIGPLIPTLLSTNVLVRDAEGTEILLCLRNWLPSASRLSVDEARTMFPEGTVLRLLEPYIGRSLTGYAMLRADNPANLQVVSRPGLNLDAGESAERATELAEVTKKRGDEHLSAGWDAAALDCYSAALALGDLLPQPLRAGLFSSRAAAALKLERFASALLDCDRALALDPSDLRAALCRCDALLGTGRSAGAVAYATQQLACCNAADEAVWVQAIRKARQAETIE